MEPRTGAQPALHFEWRQFSWNFIDVIVLIHLGYDFFANGHK